MSEETERKVTEAVREFLDKIRWSDIQRGLRRVVAVHHPPIRGDEIDLGTVHFGNLAASISYDKPKMPEVCVFCGAPFDEVNYSPKSVTKTYACGTYFGIAVHPRLPIVWRQSGSCRMVQNDRAIKTNGYTVDGWPLVLKERVFYTAWIPTGHSEELSICSDEIHSIGLSGNTVCVHFLNGVGKDRCDVWHLKENAEKVLKEEQQNPS